MAKSRFGDNRGQDNMTGWTGPDGWLENFYGEEASEAFGDELDFNHNPLNNGSAAEAYSESDQYFDMYNKEWLSRLTDEQRWALNHYSTSTGANEMNQALRNGRKADAKTKKAIRALTNAIKKAELRDNMVVYRGVKDLPANLRVGDQFTERGHTSTSTVEYSAAKYGNTMMKIHVPKGKGVGAFINSMSNFKGEYEYLLQRDTTFRVDSITDGANGYDKVVEVTIVG